MAPNLTPNYEVKFLLDPSLVLTPLHDLHPALASELSMPFDPPSVQIAVLFFDTDDQTLYRAGWSPRIRKTDSKRGFELTYKKRYPVYGEDIDAALDVANNDGFAHDKDNKYKAQGEWGYEKMTLSVSRDKDAGDKGFVGMSLPGVDAAREMLVKDAPDKFNDDGGKKGWGSKILKTARVYGPVLTRRWVGDFNGTKVTVEFWPISKKAGGAELVVEASFKADTIEEARKIREEVTKFLDGKGWLVHRDSLKTQLIMDNY